MTCPHCGYARSACDTYCLRCRLLAAEGRSRRPLPPAEQTIVMAGPPPATPAVRHFSWGWLIALLAVLGVLLGLFLWQAVTAPHPPVSGRPNIAARVTV